MSYIVEVWIDDNERSRDGWSEETYKFGKTPVLYEYTDKEIGNKLYKMIKNCDIISKVEQK